jgi:hypothetical protein
MRGMRKGGRKLLVATLGVGAISYVACGGTVSNPLPPPQDASMDHPADTAADAPKDAVQDHFSPLDLVANIVAPSP